ncbi:MAG: hypothetical protein INQ03_14595 [Candidatus Heimdallarchaeota archaeon]|nr:hypothetical protein [Candidatus Heimdallarchaeota archaeon]
MSIVLKDSKTLYSGEILKTKLARKNIERIQDALINGEDILFIKWLEKQCFNLNTCVIGECAHSLLVLLHYRIVTRNISEESRLLHVIKKERKAGIWERFPFYMMIHVLNQSEHPLAFAELKYALPAIETRLKRNSYRFDEIKRDILLTAIEKVRISIRELI